MDQKHAMLYPPIDDVAAADAMSQDQRRSASAAVGLPAEAPPSYAMATAAASSTPSSPAGGWSSSAASSKPASAIVVQPGLEPNQQFQQQPLPPQPTAEEPTTTTTASRLKLGPHPSAVTCPACGVSKTTRVHFTPNTRTHLCALLLCLVGWCCCACWVPYCMNSCRTGNHYCSNCNAFLGTHVPHGGKWL